MPFRTARGEMESAFRSVPYRGLVGKLSPEVERGTYSRKLRPCLAQVRVERDRLLVERAGTLHAPEPRVESPDCLTLQEGLVGREVLGRPLGECLLLPDSECHVER